LVVCLVLLIAVSLYYLYPRDFFARHFENPVKVSQTSLVYLQQLNKQYGKNEALQLQQIRHQIKLGHLKQAEFDLEAYAKHELSPESREEVTWLQYILAREGFYQLKKSAKGYQEKKRAIAAHLERLLVLTDTEVEQKLLAKDSLALGAEKFSANIYKKLLKQHPDQPIAIYLSAAQATRYSKDYQTSSQYYFKAQQLAKNSADKVKYFISGVSVLEESGDAKKALQAAIDNFNKLPVNKDLSMYIAEVALRANKPAVAQTYLRKVLYQSEENNAEVG
jgi:hypothetical protein